MRAASFLAGILACGTFALAEVKMEPLDYKAGDVTLKSVLVFDDSVKDKRPGVLVVPEWWGLNDYAKRRAEQLAKLGYVAMAVDMYGDGKNTQDPKEASQMAGVVRGDPKLAHERMQAALDALKARPEVDGDRIAAIGYCFGGSVVLEAARAGLPLAGVVSFHGGLGTKGPAKADTLKARILVCHGADDAAISPEEIAGFIKEMKDAKADWQLIYYSGAVHAFTNPDAGKMGNKNVAYNAKADARSWEAMKAFFAEIFAKR